MPLVWNVFDSLGILLLYYPTHATQDGMGNGLCDWSGLLRLDTCLREISMLSCLLPILFVGRLDALYLVP